MALLKTLILAAMVAACVGDPASARAQSLTQDEALALAFPDADFERRTAFLSEDELGRAAELAGPDVELESSIVTHYVALRDGHGVGVAYFDVHRVRTLDEVLMVVVEPGARVRRVETVSFREPPEYTAPEGWLRLFETRRLDDDLAARRAIPNITGATLTAGAVTRAVRRTLAIHAVIDPLAERRSTREPDGDSAEPEGVAPVGRKVRP